MQLPIVLTRMNLTNAKDDMKISSIAQGLKEV